MSASSATLAGPLLFGAATGLRATVPLALLAARAAPRPAAALLTVAAATEVVLDKLPSTPSRLLPRGLIARVTAASIGGALLGRRSGHPLVSALLGAMAAVGGAVAGYSLRQMAEMETATPDLPWAVAEDGACLLLGWAAVNAN
jgi:uncharacterized membrane protein